ncbi:MAG TPA: hypothetical protein VK436_17255 [Methanocella sp.]|nr:hypothetical protein [Methanocella sp.]
MYNPSESKMSAIILVASTLLCAVVSNLADPFSIFRLMIMLILKVLSVL